jgi:hypothetical protein
MSGVHIVAVSVEIRSACVLAEWAIAIGNLGGLTAQITRSNRPHYQDASAKFV